MEKELSRRDFLKIGVSIPLMKLAMDFSPSLDKGFMPLEADSPNILVIVFDALSATNVSLYGYPRETTPHLSRFAEQATVFNRHYAGGSFTPSSLEPISGPTVLFTYMER